MSVVRLALAQLDEEAVRLAGMQPRDVRAPIVHPRALGLQMLHAARDVVRLEAHEIDALAFLREELAHRLGRVGRLHQLDVAGAERKDRVLEAEFLRLAPLVDGEAEQLGVALDRGLEVAHDHADLDRIADVLLHALFSEPTTPTKETHSPGAPPRLWVRASLRPRATLWIWRLPASPRSCSHASNSMRRPEAPIGWPNDFRPPSGLTASSPSRSNVPASTSFHAVPRAANARSSISTSSVGVKQSWTSAIASSWRGSLIPAWAYASTAEATTSGKVV